MYNGFTWTDEQARESFEKRHGTPRVAKPLVAKEVEVRLVTERLALEVGRTRVETSLRQLENTVFSQVGAS